VRSQQVTVRAEIVTEPTNLLDRVYPGRLPLSAAGVTDSMFHDVLRALAHAGPSSVSEGSHPPH
jgi:hypothetical protein